MLELLLIVHLLICAAMIGVVLMQKSEGGALGIGGGGGGGGFLTGRGTANLLTRTTAGLAVAFFATSILLSIVSGRSVAPDAPFGQPGAVQPADRPASGGTPATGTQPGSLLDSLKKGQGGQRLPSIPENK